MTTAQPTLSPADAYRAARAARFLASSARRAGLTVEQAAIRVADERAAQYEWAASLY